MEKKKVSIEGKVAFVSGSNRGIGKAITVALLKNGAKKVYAGARSVESLGALTEEFGDRIVPVTLDVTDDASIVAAAQVAQDVDILINNAGVFATGNFSDGNLRESLEKNLAVNVWGLTKVTQAFFEIIKKQESAAIVNVSSVVGLANMPMGLTYSVSKAAAHSITQGLRGELQGTGVLVAGVYPGPIDTDMTKDIDMPKDSPENVAANIIAGIEAGTEDIFPDPMSQKIGAMYASDPKAVEAQMANLG